MNLFIILVIIAVITTIVLYISAKSAQEVKEETPKFQPRQMTVIGKEVYVDETSIEVVKPKRKYKKRKSKKTIVEDISIKKPKISK